MTDETPQAPEEIRVRYVAGVSPSLEHDGEMLYSIIALYEKAAADGAFVRVGSQFIAMDMTHEQVEHLHMQLGNALVMK